MGTLINTILNTVTPIRNSIASTVSTIPGVNTVRNTLASMSISLRPMQRAQAMMASGRLGGLGILDKVRGTFMARGRSTQTLGPGGGILSPALSSFKAIGYRR